MRPDDLFIKHKKIKEKSLEKFLTFKNEYSELSKEFDKTHEAIEKLYKEISQENSNRRSLVFDIIKNKSLEKYKNHMSFCVRILLF